MRLALLSLLLIAVAGCAGPPRAPSCDGLVLDLERGTLSGVAPTASPAAFQAAFPCATGETEEGGLYNFGGGVFYLDHDFYAYTHRDFIEAREDFVGRTVPAAVLGSSAAQADATFGTPERVEDGARLYDRRYGCLRVEVVGGAVTEVGVHAQTCAEVEVPR
ncbi:MAG: hypothetical protein CMM84_09945 [Rhodothermaceae bacterium]|nr:hypothetical protein [Rhodothermaceae bacterium]MBC12808.1 hypothetical protein [Rhodothermaceae bacterium]